MYLRSFTLLDIFHPVRKPFFLSCSEIPVILECYCHVNVDNLICIRYVHDFKKSLSIAGQSVGAMHIVCLSY